ncbi:3785_t:CDS:2, partial [Dentiscutata heterogama]
MTSSEPPVLQSINETLSSIPPRELPFTENEIRISLQLNPDQFNVQTTINMHAFRALTNQHPNRPFIEYLIKSITKGFRFNFTGPRTKLVQPNLKSIDLEPTALEKYIQEEISKGHICSPFTEELPPCDLYQINPCGLVEKKGTNTKVYRVISHLSAPFGSSINDGIDSLEFATKYENVNHAIRWINLYGRGCTLSKIDIKDAYRILPVHPVDQVLQGMEYKEKLYFDKALAFGNKASDDFLIISKSDGKKELQQFLQILNIINVPFKESKLEDFEEMGLQKRAPITGRLANVVMPSVTPSKYPETRPPKTKNIRIDRKKVPNTSQNKPMVQQRWQSMAHTKRCANKIHQDVIQSQDPLVKQILKTIEANHRHTPVRQKMHITRAHLRHIKRSLDLKNPDDLLFWTVALAAFYGLARLGELIPNDKTDKTKIPSIRALRFEKIGAKTFATIQLTRTKNHKSANRVSLIINPTADDLCPIQALKAYTIRHTCGSYAPRNESLFIRHNGSWSTKRWFCKKLKAILPHSNVTGHSFRAGGTTELVIRG